jgi:NAD(P)-dependent dehydrogenase (short-subunit alcohol dehydrogenase family)
MSRQGKVALISGGSRAIGRACASELASAGFDVALTSRTLDEGEHLESEAAGSLRRPVSLAAAAELVERAGARSLSIPVELSDPTSVSEAVDEVMERWGRIDVVVHNGRYMGPGHMDRLVDTSIDLLRTQIEANLFAPLLINKAVIPQMIANGGGIIINMDSPAAYATPLTGAGQGGWGIGYAVSKGAAHRIAGILRAEHGVDGILSINLQPGRIDEGNGRGAPAQVVGRVARWLCTSHEANAFNGQTIEAQAFCFERELLPSWPGPTGDLYGPLDCDLAGFNLQELIRRSALSV